MERLQLGAHRHLRAIVKWGEPRMMEGHLVLEHLIDEISLSHAPTAIDGHKLRFVAVIQSVKFLYFLFSPDDFSHYATLYFAAKVQLLLKWAKYKIIIRLKL